MHSGTATGGHYFAYIWSTKHSKWVEFNDSVVCFIEEETAMKNAFGGVENGMSAYLLMYSQLDLSASESTTQAVPDDIRLTVEAEDRAWEQEKAEIEAERRRLDLFVSYKNVERKYRFDMGVTVGHVQEHLRKDFGLEDQFPSKCPLVFFLSHSGSRRLTKLGASPSGSSPAPPICSRHWLCSTSLYRHGGKDSGASWLPAYQQLVFFHVWLIQSREKELTPVWQIAGNSSCQ